MHVNSAGNAYYARMATLLAIIPHPDDEAYAFGGTITLAARAGWRCLVECVTFGEGGERHDGGGPDPGMVALARARELDDSCAKLGAKPPEFWGWPDGGLVDRKDGVRRTRTAIRRAQADVVLSLGPDGAYGHPDHLAVYAWVRDAIATLESAPLTLYAAFSRGLFLPQYDKCVASGIMGDPPLLAAEGIGVDQPDIALSTAAVRDLKLAAIGAHRSQLPGGDPRALFPDGLVDALLDEEWFTVGTEQREPAVQFARLLGEAG
jgi:N-acetyl-1-D-myo-inositol-2-amino-2-deoxy-alpha-D-glucopyranoside deacetylase